MNGFPRGTHALFTGRYERIDQETVKDPKISSPDYRPIFVIDVVDRLPLIAQGNPGPAPVPIAVPVAKPLSSTPATKRKSASDDKLESPSRGGRLEGSSSSKPAKTTEEPSDAKKARLAPAAEEAPTVQVKQVPEGKGKNKESVPAHE